MNSRFETFSFLPPLSPGQIQAQAETLLSNDFIPLIEFSESPAPGETYWQAWHIQLTHASPTAGIKTESQLTSGTLLTNIDSCARRHPYAYIRLSGYDKEQQQTAMSFIVHTPNEGM